MSGETVGGLRRDAIGLREVQFQSITVMAPAAAVAASIPSGAAFVGGSLPLSVLIALVACLFTASCAARRNERDSLEPVQHLLLPVLIRRHPSA
ncbi:hypothetical protein [Streptomyces sp. NPDC002619]|uniref:hypothetical protein n=1 Tax=Streptomyces sp. NPDC002619 TaxID=3364655 RepID=UPI0036759F08